MFERPTRIEFPTTEPYSPQRAALGKMLFFDARLSGAINMSCATCHNPSFGWETPASRAIGAMNQPLARHTPTIENLTESEHFYWDGRIASLKEQIRGPITHPLKMNSSMRQVQRRLENISGYRRYFEIAFPDTGLTEDTILVALATYQRTLRSGWSPFDDWVEGDEDAISSSAQRGFDVFTGRGQCVSCHQGWAFTDHDFHNVSLGDDDIGRGVLDPTMRYRFKTPGLRNIALRAPYMHNGSLNSLRAVVEHYRRGGAPNTTASDIEPLTEMSDRDVNDLIAFLETLTAYAPHVSAPALPVD
ncbi:c-type cytochrome [Rhodobacteraceae bacterium R_SAG7]|jgi:cytochrome c peroxidase|uniref:cytochrome-c peroxidase n=1 Tax=Rhodobacterales TaxID=204455 RepID=UPI00005548CD|nr:cytochrome c peroxidase [Ruegeria sp. TM1040]ABF62109.1 Cytochrome-c peroxidase [Ruegeria sp. TM1040]MDF9301650.1 cytochrome c peroxidase [Tritonibacter mobilis]NKW78033.1 c-type cytochrome [Rhodobacteraceae bacterium R_SAG7]